MDATSGICGSTIPEEGGSGKGTGEAKEKGFQVWVLRNKSTGRVLYLEVYKDFVDLLFGFLALRTGAIIKLTHDVSPMMTELKTNTGVFSVYSSLEKLDDSFLHIDKEALLDPIQRIRLSDDLQSLDNHDFECCNADCAKHMANSRQVCRDCDVATHFSCITCGGYFRENAHTALCYTPWKPCKNHMTGAPILTRYTVIQSCSPAVKKARADMSRDPSECGYVKDNIPFMLTNELHVAPLSTSLISQLLKKFETSSCADLECNELSVGKSEVIVLLGAAMTSPTPLTDVFGSMCNNQTKVATSRSASFSRMPPVENTSTSDGDNDSLIRTSISKQVLMDRRGSGEQPLDTTASTSGDPLAPPSSSSVPPIPGPSSQTGMSDIPSQEASGNQSSPAALPDGAADVSLQQMPTASFEGEGPFLTRLPSTMLNTLRQSIRQMTSESSSLPPNSKTIDNPLYQQRSDAAPDSLASPLLPYATPPPDGLPPQQHPGDFPFVLSSQDSSGAAANQPFPAFHGIFLQPEGFQQPGGSQPPSVNRFPQAEGFQPPSVNGFQQAGAFQPPSVNGFQQTGAFQPPSVNGFQQSGGFQRSSVNGAQEAGGFQPPSMNESQQADGFQQPDGIQKRDVQVIPGTTGQHQGRRASGGSTVPTQSTGQQ